MNACIIIVIVILALVTLLIINFICNGNKNNLERFEMVKNATVVLFKTHTWNHEINKFVMKLYNETKNIGIDFYVLLHDDTLSIMPNIGDPIIRERLIVYDEKQIKSTYLSGFYSMWLSNHWILMWFFKKYPQYDYYWSIEYDVRIIGDSSRIWLYDGNDDFIFPNGPFQNLEWTWKEYYQGDRLSDLNKWYGYLQLARYSHKFLKYLDGHYTNQENGQDEMITFSLFKRGINEIKLTGSDKFLSSFIKDSWSVDNNDSEKHKAIIKSVGKTDDVIILHPVK